ncbi:hypothetical protein AAY473_000527, partial [Plecturocebus cupreus]
MVGVSSYPARKSRIGMDSPVGGRQESAQRASVLLWHPVWSAAVRSGLTATSAFWVQVILLPQRP